MDRNRAPRARSLALVAMGAALLAPAAARAQIDDAILFTTTVPPNVLLLLDNSASMTNVIWHPAFDPTAVPVGCAVWDNDTEYIVSNLDDADEVRKGNHTECGNTREVFEDTNTGNEPTRWSGRYLNWYFSDAANVVNPDTGDTYADEIQAKNNATTSACVGGPNYSRYRRARISVLQQTMLEVVCETNEGRGAEDGLRFGTAQFRTPASGGTFDPAFDPNGAFVGEGIDDHTPQHANDLEAHIGNLQASSWTPLGEGAFQLYTYLMSRTTADRAFGHDPATGLETATRFPAYEYDAVKGENDPSKTPPDPVQYWCQKNFLIIVTDGEPSKDSFEENPDVTEALGFTDFAGSLIGDYHVETPTAEVEVPGDADESGWYLDDIAKYMQDFDFRPDFAEKQVIDTYTVGFTTSATANGLLQKTADNGNGLFFFATTPDELKAALTAALVDIIEKTQSFTASTVPASRTVDGADFYTSFFLPLSEDPFWQGHLQAYHITAAGNLEDQNGNCPLIDPTAGECNSGPFDPDAEPFWDAGEEIPLPGSRTLYASNLTGVAPGTPSRVDFDAGTLTYADLELELFAADGDPTTAAPNRTYAGSIAQNEEGLADEIIQYEHGCEFGTGVSEDLLASPPVDVDAALQTGCVPRSWRLGDIFHSNPIVVSRPGAFIFEESYKQFKSDYSDRDRLIYAGANDGFVHAFHAGDWISSPAPGSYDEGTGAEVFGFMPWQTREKIKFHYTKNSVAEHYHVDGSPEAADAWFQSSATATSKAADGSEWHTMLLGGLRQGGNQYYALDVTDPDALTFPEYLWEFPNELDVTYGLVMGQTWGTPIVTRVKLRVGPNGNPDGNGIDQGFERWVVIVTAGYDVTGNPNHPSFAAAGLKGRAIFMLEAKTGKPIGVAPLNSGATGEAEGYAVPSSPSVLDVDSDGYADLVYVGDLGGSVWKWVIRPIGEDRANDGSGLLTQPAWTLKKFFQAPRYKDGSNWLYKSIFFPPSATLHRGKLFLAFGTGERADLAFEGPTGTDDDNNRFYVVSDLDPFEKRSTPFGTLDESDLTSVTSDESCQSIGTRGFYFVVENGEKFVTNTEIFARDVIAASYVPTDVTDPCETGGGEAALYAFDVICSEGYFDDGGNPTRKLEVGGGFPTDPRISVGVDGKDNFVFIEKSRAEVESFQADDLPGTGGLLYWRELP